MLKKPFTLLSGLALAAMFAFTAVAQPPPPPKKAAVAPAAKAKPAPKTDAEIQQCITDKLGASAKLKDQGLSATVVGGVATFVGTARDGASKGGVASIAKACGAKKTVNNITVMPKPTPTPKAKATPKPKP